MTIPDRLRFWRPVWSAQGSLDAHAMMFRDNLTAAHASDCPEGRRIWLGMAAANLATWRERLDEAELALSQLAEHAKREEADRTQGAAA